MKVLTSATAILFFTSSLAQAEVTGSISTKGKKDKEYHTLATVSLQEAVQAALSKVPGKAVEAELGSEDGFLVYEIKVIADNNTTHKIYVDAGNQTLLKDEIKKGIF